MRDSVTAGVVPPATRPRRGYAFRAWLAAVTAVVSLAAVAGCDLAGASDTAATPVKGGTLFINMVGGLNSLDPQGQYEASSMNVLRLTSRTLTTYRSSATNASEIVPDLATDTGRASENNTVWKFTLKPNVKWQGGEPVTCSQVKYGIERSFSPLIDGGVPYPKTYLKANAKAYQGPYLDNDNNGKGLESIVCLDERNIEFHLAQPVGDFSYTLAMSTFAPVPPAKDTKADYGKIPYSNGPYKITSRDDKQMVMERNNFWTETNDQVRKAYPDKIVFTFLPDDDGVITNQLIEDQGDARNTVLLDANVAPNFLQQVINDPGLSARTIAGPTGGVRFMAINVKNQTNLACRQALIYGFNKRKWRAVNGGAVTGDYATSMIGPNIAGHKVFDLYDSINNPEGNIRKATDLMDEQARQGHPCKSTIQVAFPDSSLRRRLVATVVEAYQQIGIQVKPVALPPATYYAQGIGDPANPYDMMLVGWIPDWASGSAIIPPQFDGRLIPAVDPETGHGSNNPDFPLLNDPKINAQMDAAIAEPDRSRQEALWGDLDQQIQAAAVTIPILYEKGIRIAGTNVLGGYISPAFGSPDLVSLGLAKP